MCRVGILDVSMSYPYFLCAKIGFIFESNKFFVKKMSVCPFCLGPVCLENDVYQYA